MNQVAAWPLSRAPLLDQGQPFWKRSQETLSQVAKRLGDAALPPNILTVAVSGGLGRMEESHQSDIDLIVVVDDCPEQAECERLHQQVRTHLRDFNLGDSRPDGIFAAAVSSQALLAEQTLGQVAEEMAVFGTRMQILLDAQPVWGTARYEQLVRDICGRFQLLEAVAAGLSIRYLLDDLMRYYRSLAIRYHALDRDRPARWRLLNVKFRHSRRLMYAGLLMLLGEMSLVSSRADERWTWLEQQLRLVPLERLLITGRSGASGMAELASQYESVLRKLDDTAFRTALLRDNEQEYESHPAYQQALEALTSLEALIAQRLNAHADRWGDFYHQLLV